jgi:hypothetical protein
MNKSLEDIKSQLKLLEIMPNLSEDQKNEKADLEKKKTLIEGGINGRLDELNNKSTLTKEERTERAELLKEKAQLTALQGEIKDGLLNKPFVERYMRDEQRASKGDPKQQTFNAEMEKRLETEVDALKATLGNASTDNFRALGMAMDMTGRYSLTHAKEMEANSEEAANTIAKSLIHEIKSLSAPELDYLNKISGPNPSLPPSGIDVAKIEEIHGRMQTFSVSTKMVEKGDVKELSDFINSNLIARPSDSVSIKAQQDKVANSTGAAQRQQKEVLNYLQDKQLQGAYETITISSKESAGTDEANTYRLRAYLDSGGVVKLDNTLNMSERNAKGIASTMAQFKGLTEETYGKMMDDLIKGDAKKLQSETNLSLDQCKNALNSLIYGNGEAFNLLSEKGIDTSGLVLVKIKNGLNSGDDHQLGESLNALTMSYMETIKNNTGATEFKIPFRGKTPQNLVNEAAGPHGAYDAAEKALTQNISVDQMQEMYDKQGALNGADRMIFANYNNAKSDFDKRISLLEMMNYSDNALLYKINQSDTSILTSAAYAGSSQLKSAMDNAGANSPDVSITMLLKGTFGGRKYEGGASDIGAEPLKTYQTQQVTNEIKQQQDNSAKQTNEAKEKAITVGVADIHHQTTELYSPFAGFSFTEGAGEISQLTANRYGTTETKSGTRKYDQKAQENTTKTSMDFMENNRYATTEETENAKKYQMIWNNKTNAYDFRQAGKDGYVVNEKGEYITQKVKDANGVEQDVKIKGYNSDQAGIFLNHLTSTINMSGNFANKQFKGVNNYVNGFSGPGIDADQRAALAYQHISEKPTVLAEDAFKNTRVKYYNTQTKKTESTAFSQKNYDVMHARTDAIGKMVKEFKKNAGEETK